MSLQNDLNFGIKYTNKIAQELERELKREFQNTLKELKSLIAKQYELHDMTYTEMQKYNRLKNLQKEIEKHLSELSKASGASLRNGLGSIYAESYYTTAYAMERAVQAKLSYTALDRRVIQAMVQNPLSGLTLNERLLNQRREVIIRIKSVLTQGLIKGESYGKMAKSIQAGLEMEYTKAIRIARTEAHRCQQIGRAESLHHAEEQGVKGHYVWRSALDSRTRDSHRAMDGQVADKDGYFTLPSGLKTAGPGLSGDPAEDINCRCDMVYEVEGFEPTVRRVRGEGVIPYTTYKDWYDNRLAG